MLSHEENVLLTGVRSGTPMGEMLRRYWIPACLSEELPEPGGAPIRLRLLGEDLVAFRGHDGSVGVMHEGCPHRRASLVLARNEDCALVCLYHGWKIAADGRILDMPSEAETSTFKDRLRHVAYPVREEAGFVWTYLGPTGTEPPLPDLPWMRVPATNRGVAKMHEAANWVQSLEGAIDSAHSSVLHQDLIRASKDVQRSSTGDSQDFLNERPSADTRPKLQAERTPYGMRYVAIRRPIHDPETTQYIRVSAWASPFYVQIPPNDRYSPAQVFVPIDEHNTFLYFIEASERYPVDQDNWRRRNGSLVGPDLDENYRKRRTIENNYLQDRGAMADGRSFTGIHGLMNQDMAMQETMGPIVDRSLEHLGTSDVAIIKYRRVLLDSLREFHAGSAPIGLTPDVDPAEILSVESLIPLDQPWQDYHAKCVGELRVGT